jgi:hypothetical protein
MSKRGSRVDSLGLLGIAFSLLAVPTVASAEYFSLYLKCEGEVISGAGKTGANLDLALRDNNQSALIQRSNILPVGEKMKYEVSPASYSMVYRSPDTRSRVYYDWRRGYLFRWDPRLDRLAYIRVSIDRQSGRMEGDILNNEDISLARFGMRCEKADPKDLPAPKF